MNFTKKWVPGHAAQSENLVRIFIVDQAAYIFPGDCQIIDLPYPAGLIANTLIGAIVMVIPIINSMYVCMYVCMHACMHVCVCMCVYVCVYVCMCVCMYVRTYVRNVM